MSDGENQETEMNLSALTQNKYFWVVAALLLGVIGWFGYTAVKGTFQSYKLTLVDAPKQAETPGTSTFTWRIDGPPATINHTSVHIGATSNPGELGQNVKPGDTKYTDFVKDFANGNFDIPLQFVGNLPLNAQAYPPGKYYFRVHAVVKDKNYWSDEYTLDVVPATSKISVVAVPPEVQAGKVASFTWRIDGPPVQVTNTAVYFGTTSNPGALGKDVKPSATSYKAFVRDFMAGPYNVPLQFIGNAEVATAGAYFLRAHAEINGENFWSDEKTFNAVAGPTIEATPTGARGTTRATTQTP